LLHLAIIGRARLLTDRPVREARVVSEPRLNPTSMENRDRSV